MQGSLTFHTHVMLQGAQAPWLSLGSEADNYWLCSALLECKTLIQALIECMGITHSLSYKF